jgi:hypothetical protein
MGTATQGDRSSRQNGAARNYSHLTSACPFKPIKGRCQPSPQSIPQPQFSARRKTNQNKLNHTETHQNKVNQSMGGAHHTHTSRISFKINDHRARSCRIVGPEGWTLAFSLWTLDYGKYKLPSPRSLIAYWAFPAVLERRTASISCARVRAGGHNNTEINPVFRGML